MDKVQTSDVAGVVSSHEGFGSGAFASRGLDADSPCAVIPFFNRTEELLSASNTWKGQPAAAIRKHTTTVTFSQPVDIASVLDSEMNFFIAPEAAHQQDSHAGLFDRFGDYRQGFVPAFGSLQVLRDGGRPDQKQLT